MIKKAKTLSNKEYNKGNKNWWKNNCEIQTTYIDINIWHQKSGEWKILPKNRKRWLKIRANPTKSIRFLNTSTEYILKI